MADMTDIVMLLVALMAFVGLIAGWMILPDAPAAEKATSVSTPQAMPEAA